MLRHLQSWIDQLRRQRLKPWEKLARMLLNHLDGILNSCKTKGPLGVVETVIGNSRALLRRSRGCRDLDYPLRKAQRLPATKTEIVASESHVGCTPLQNIVQSRLLRSRVAII